MVAFFCGNSTKHAAVFVLEIVLYRNVGKNEGLKRQ